MRASKRFLGMVFALALSGCNVLDTMLDRTVDTAAQQTGERVGERAGDAAADIIVQMTPQLIGLYVQNIFSCAFYGAWGWGEQENYEVGEWTRWRAVDSEGAPSVVLEKAFLTRTAEGNEWWKVQYTNLHDNQEIVLEGLFSPGREKLLRLRGRFPGQAASEIPVQESIVYAREAALTAESLAAARVGEATVSVPAGSFRATHYSFVHPTSGGTLEWYASDAVAGGLVKYALSSDDEGDVSTAGAPVSLHEFAFELVAHGTGAKSELGSF